MSRYRRSLSFRVVLIAVNDLFMRAEMLCCYRTKAQRVVQQTNHHFKLIVFIRPEEYNLKLRVFILYILSIFYSCIYSYRQPHGDTL